MKEDKFSKKRSRKNETFDTKRQAFRTAKRDYKIPVSSQPDETVKPNTNRGKEEKLDKRNSKLFIFKILGGLFGSDKRIYMREDKPYEYPDGSKQIKHFNVGEKPPEKLKDHYNFKK